MYYYMCLSYLILSYQVHVYSHPDSLLSFKEPLRVPDTPGSLSTLSYVSTYVYLIKCCYITSGASRIYQRGGANPKELGQTYYLVKICRKLHEMQWRIQGQSCMLPPLPRLCNVRNKFHYVDLALITVRDTFQDFWIGLNSCFNHLLNFPKNRRIYRISITFISYSIGSYLKSISKRFTPKFSMMSTWTKRREIRLLQIYCAMHPYNYK